MDCAVCHPGEHGPLARAACAAHRRRAYGRGAHAPRWSIALAGLVGLVLLAGAARADDPPRMEALPPELEGVGVTEHLNTQLPLDLEFTDSDGRKLKLGELFQGQRPVLLTLNYYKCPMLCTLQLNGLLDGLRELKWTPGKEYEVVTISFDPDEGPRLAAAKKTSYMQALGRPEAAAGWRFLTGSAESVQRVLDATGFNVKWNAERGQWMHVAAAILCTPDGHISRYLYGVMYPEATLRLSLVEAGQGKIGSTADRIYLFCYHYDPQTGGYQASAIRIMQLGGGLTLLVLGGGLIGLWRWEARRRRAAPAEVVQAHP